MKIARSHILASVRAADGTYRWKTGLYVLRIAQKGLLVLQVMQFLFSMPVVYRPHPLYWHGMLMQLHAQAQCWKGLSSHKTALPQRVLEYYATVATERAGYVLYRALVTSVTEIYHLLGPIRFQDFLQLWPKNKIIYGSLCYPTGGLYAV